MKKSRKLGKRTKNIRKGKATKAPKAKARELSPRRRVGAASPSTASHRVGPRPGSPATSRPVRATRRLAARVFARSASKAAKKGLQTSASRPAPLTPATTLVPRAKPRRQHAAHAARPATVSRNANRHVVRMSRVPQYTYMKAPGPDSGFNVGDSVEVFCDHERESERVRGWIKGVVVQVDNKLVAVQFRSNVFLTDGWMVPDRILWYSLASDQIRTLLIGKKGSPKALPDY